LPQGAAGQILEYQEFEIGRLFNSVDGGDPRVIQGGDGTGFLAEAGDSLRGTYQVRRQELERYIAAEIGVPRLIDHTHSALTQFSDDLINGI
jgi:hypothetical protein